MGTGSSICGREIRFQNGGKIFPFGVGVKLSSFVMQNRAWCCRRKKLENFCFLAGGTKLVWFCMFNSREQAIVCKGIVENTSSLVLSYFLSIFSFKRLFCRPLFIYVHINVLGRTISEKETDVFDLLKSASRRRHLRIL